MALGAVMRWQHSGLGAYFRSCVDAAVRCCQDADDSVRVHGVKVLQEVARIMSAPSSSCSPADGGVVEADVVDGGGGVCDGEDAVRGSGVCAALGFWRDILRDDKLMYWLGDVSPAMRAGALECAACMDDSISALLEVGLLVEPCRVCLGALVVVLPCHVVPCLCVSVLIVSMTFLREWSCVWTKPADVSTFQCTHT